MASSITSLLFLLIVPPLLLGVIARTKAFVAGRKGPPLLQVYFDLWKLFRKDSVRSRTASPITRFAPVVLFTVMVSAGFLLPLAGPAPFRFTGDLLLFAYLLALARFVIILAALDVGSSFAGMGASREATVGALSELPLFLGLVAAAVTARSASLSEIFVRSGDRVLLHPAGLLLFLAFFIVLLAENSRIPIDDPETHLELTMIHEAMILDTGGPALGVLLYASAVKLFRFMMLAISVVWPGPAVFSWGSLGAVLLKAAGMSVAVGIVESLNARLRLIKVPQLLVAGFVVTLFALLVTLFGRGI